MKEITNSDARFETLKKGFNLRFPDQSSMSNVGNGYDVGASRVALCTNDGEIETAYKNALAIDKGRVTVRSGGHCYEGFVSNRLATDEVLTVIDVSQMKGVFSREAGDVFSTFDGALGNTPYEYKIMAGNQNWETAVSLFHKNNVALPAGSCYAVGVGGHISGGGYGFLSRQHGLTVDALEAVDIMVPNNDVDGKELVRKHVHSRSASEDDRNLLYACRGAGGGQFGIIVAYYFNKLPTPPKQVFWLEMNLDCDLAQFTALLNNYHYWFAYNQEYQKTDTYRLFTKLELRHINTGPISIGIQYFDKDGTTNDSEILKDFLESVIFNSMASGPSNGVSEAMVPSEQAHAPYSKDLASRLLISDAEDAVRKARRMDWLAVVQNVNGIGQNQKGRYKSAYQRAPFTPQIINALWEALRSSRAQSQIDQTQSLVQIQSYGGAINKYIGDQNLTSACQRDSILKWQPQSYWKNQEELPANSYDNVHHSWLYELYKSVFTDGTPKQVDGFDGCYINYPDMDMTRPGGTPGGVINYEVNGFPLYFPNMDIRNRLRDTKTHWDPHNRFKNAMSIGPFWTKEV